MRQMRRRTWLGLALFTVVACETGPTAPPSVDSIALIVPQGTMQVGQTQQLSAVLKAADGSTLTGRTVIWSSSDPTIAAVSASGQVTALLPASVTIRATSEGQTATAAISVTPGDLAVINVTLRDSIVTMGASTTVSVVMQDSAGNKIEDLPVSYSTSDGRIASAGADGIITTFIDGEVTVSASAGGKTASASLTVLVDRTSPYAYFDREPRYGPSLASYVPDGGQVYTVVSADVNRDGRMDLIVHLSRLRTVLERAALPLDAPVTTDRIVVLAGTEAGELADITEALFGTPVVDLGGASSRNVAIYDLNADGRPDFVYATNREDGRPCEVARQQCLSWGAPNAVLMSRADGRYERVLFGEPSYHHSVAVMPTARGPAIITSSHRLDDRSGTKSLEAYLYANGAFEPANDFPWLPGSFLYVPYPGKTAAVTTHLLGYGSSGPRFPSPPALLLATLQGGTWTVSDTVPEAVDFTTVSYRSWSGDTCDDCVIVFSEEGQDFVTLGYNDGCTVQPSPAAPPLLIANRTSSLVLGGLRGRTLLVEGVDTQPDTRFVAYEVQGNRLKRATPFVDLVTNVMYNRHDCRDINGDGYEDVVAYTIRRGAQPIAYLNDGQGQFRRFSESPFPQSERSSDYDRAIFADIDGDAIEDLIYMANAQSFEIWKGRRRLPAS